MARSRTLDHHNSSQTQADLARAVTAGTASTIHAHGGRRSRRVNRRRTRAKWRSAIPCRSDFTDRVGGRAGLFLIRSVSSANITNPPSTTASPEFVKTSHSNDVARGRVGGLWRHRIRPQVERRALTGSNLASGILRSTTVAIRHRQR
jgi:hypothetical protein